MLRAMGQLSGAATGWLLTSMGSLGSPFNSMPSNSPPTEKKKMEILCKIKREKKKTEEKQTEGKTLRMQTPSFSMVLQTT